jgi:cytochrome c556
MRRLYRTLVPTAVVMTLSAGGAGRSDASVDPQGSGSKAAKKMTEQDYRAIMKKVGPTYASMRKNLDSGDFTKPQAEARQLAGLFGEVEKFWAQHNRPDAVKWAHQARSYATQVGGAVAAVEGFRGVDARVQSAMQLRMKRARLAAANMEATCKECHGTYREGSAATGFRIKPGVLAR